MKVTRFKTVSVARAIYEAAPMTGNIVSINTATVGKEHEITWDQIEASRGEVYDQIIAIADRSIQEWQQTAV